MSTTSESGEEMTIEEAVRPAPEKCRKAWEVYALAMQHPQSFDMEMWASVSGADLDSLTDNHCGTTACLAGWGATSEGCTINPYGDVFVDGNRIGSAFNYGMALFGLTDEQADKLFFAGNVGLEEVMVDIFGPCPADVIVPQS